MIILQLYHRLALNLSDNQTYRERIKMLLYQMSGLTIYEKI